MSFIQLNISHIVDYKKGKGLEAFISKSLLFYYLLIFSNNL